MEQNFHDKIIWDWWEQWCFLGCSPLQSDQGDWIGSPTRPLLISPASRYLMLPSGVISKRHSNEWITIYHLFYSGSDSVNGHIPKKPYTTPCIQATATYCQSPVGKFMHSTNINIVIIAIGSSLHVLWTVIISHNFLRTVLTFLHIFCREVAFVMLSSLLIFLPI